MATLSLNRTRIFQGFGLVLLVAAVILFLARPSYAAVTGSVTPNTGLTDGQTVHVTASGLPANLSAATVAECTRNATGPSDCEGSTQRVNVGTDGSGNYDNATYRVRLLPDALIPTPSILCDGSGQHKCSVFVGQDLNDWTAPHTLIAIEFSAGVVPSPTPTPTPTPTHTPTPSPTPTSTPTSSPTPTTSPTSTASPTPHPTTTDPGSGSGTSVQGKTLGGTSLPRTGIPVGAFWLALAGAVLFLGATITRHLALYAASRS